MLSNGRRSDSLLNIKVEALHYFLHDDPDVLNVERTVFVDVQFVPSFLESRLTELNASVLLHQNRFGPDSQVVLREVRTRLRLGALHSFEN